MPWPNVATMVATAVTTILLSWATLSALVLCVRRYPPRRPSRVRDELGAESYRSYTIRGRRAWAMTWLAAGFVVFGVYRVARLWGTDVELPAVAVWIEAFRLGSGVYLVWAWAGGRPA